MAPGAPLYVYSDALRPGRSLGMRRTLITGRRVANAAQDAILPHQSAGDKITSGTFIDGFRA